MAPDTVKFTFGDLVGLRNDFTGRLGQVVCIMFFPRGIEYAIRWGDASLSQHNDFELLSEEEMDEILFSEESSED